jgi:hypothetical protein
VKLFKLIDAEKANYPISLLCRVLQVSRSGYYDWKDRPLSKRSRDNASLTEKITEIYIRSRQISMATRGYTPSSGLWECDVPGSGLPG